MSLTVIQHILTVTMWFLFLDKYKFSHTNTVCQNSRLHQLN